MDDYIELKPKKKHFLDKIKDLFADRRKRALYLVLFILPFLIAIGIFGYVAFKEAKNILSLVAGESEIKDEYKVPSMGYVLRDNATDYQFECFTELRQGVENGTLDDATIAGLVCKNYVIDFYTWTNKQGQYDVGGMYYLYDGEYMDGTDFKENAFLKARSTFYKYINNYINEYGANNILEVENAEVVSSVKTDNFIINEHVANKQDENGEWYDYRENHEYEAYKVKVVWNYKLTEKFDTSKYATSMYFLVIKEGEKFAIVEASENDINVDNSYVEDSSEYIDEDELENEETQEESEIDVEDIEEE